MSQEGTENLNRQGAGSARALAVPSIVGFLVLAVAYGGAVLTGEGSEAVGGGPTASSNPCRDAPARCWGTWGPWRRWGSPSPRAWCRP
jgi:hypothetical protein